MRTAWFAVTLLGVCAFGQGLGRVGGTGTGRVEGRVVTTTGEPVSKAIVRLQSTAGGRMQGFAEYSAADGSFTFVDVPPGRYAVMADKQGFIAASPPTEPVNAAAGQTARVEVLLRALGVISGRVVDAEGDPLLGARVSVMRQLWIGMRVATQRGATAITDDRGEFRLVNLEPGRYRLLAEEVLNATRAALITGLFQGSAVRQTLIPTYYPNETAAERGLTVEAKAGAETSGVVIRMRRGEAFAARGTAVHGITGEPLGGMVTAMLRENPVPMRSTASIRNPAEGFEMRGLTPGDYDLRVSTADPSRRERLLTGRAEISITSGDVGGVVIRLYPPLEITGRVTVENSDFATLTKDLGAPRGDAAGAEGTLSGGPRLRPFVTLTSAGLPAQFAVEAPDRSRSCWPPMLRRSRCPPAAVPADGNVRRALALWPRKPRLVERNAGVRVLIGGPNGQLPNVFLNLPPGEYYFALFEDVEAQTLESYGFLAQFNEMAARVSLEAGARTAAEPALIPKAAVEAALP